ncbi:MAG TPA: phage holin family protein [Candidatus Angelobacter sp.]
MNNEKSLGAALTEIKGELSAFMETRFQLLRSEMQEMIRTWKYCVPLLLVAGVLLLASWMVITFGLVALVHAWLLPSPLAWTWAGFIVGALYLVVAGVVGWFAYGELKKVGVVPKRTLKVLKQDQNWVESEAKAL